MPAPNVSLLTEIVPGSDVNVPSPIEMSTRALAVGVKLSVVTEVDADVEVFSLM